MKTTRAKLFSGNGIFFITALIFFLGVNTFYFVHKYNYSKGSIESIEIVVDNPNSIIRPLIYIKNANDIKFNFSEAYKAKLRNGNTFYFDLTGQKNLRNLRLYFQEPVDSVFVRQFIVKTKSGSEIIGRDKIAHSDGLNFFNKTNLNFEVFKSNSYLELNYTIFYPDDKYSLIYTYAVYIILIFFIIWFLLKFISISQIKELSFADLSIVVYLLLIFIPRPFNNIALIISFLLLLKEFDWKTYITNPLNLLLNLFFIILFFNDLFISTSGFSNLRASETLLPFLFLPIYISCIRNEKLLIYLPVSAFILGIFFFSTSLINVFIFRNLEYFSFNEFTKYFHPVHFSYLISFSIFYILFVVKMKRFYKNSLLVVLSVFLILTGSKLTITFTFITFGALMLKNKKVLIGMVVCSLLLAFFPPIQNRFKEIINLEAISIIKEDKIVNPYDERVNGLTLRLLLWQESIRSIDSAKKILFGLGVDKNTNKILRSNLEKRGLTNYLKYSSHNQYVNTIMRSGLFGLITLLSWIVYCIWLAVRNKNRLLLIFTLLLFFSMLTESILQWSLGITFFVTTLLFLAKPNWRDESRNFRD